ncbi:MAG: hypothetical protein IPL79_08560 [Myxococcales bacterium]|nr:hypothetical protein [Myxococcales bacterium]
MKKPHKKYPLAAITLLFAGCIGTDDHAPPPTITVTTGTSSSQAVLLVTSADGTWQPVALANNQATFAPTTHAYGVAFACRYDQDTRLGVRTSTRFLTIDDGNELHFAGCNVLTPNTSVTITGLQANQEFVANGTSFTEAQPTQLLTLSQAEIMGVLWQVKPRAVLGFTRQPVVPAQADVLINAATAVAPEFIQVASDLIAPSMEVGLTRFYSGSTFFELDTFGPADAAGIAVPPAAFRQPGDLMELDATELTSETNLRYVQHLVDRADVFSPTLPAAWNAPAPQVDQGGVSFSFTPRASWEGWYTASIQIFGLSDQHHGISVSSAWPQDDSQTAVRSPDFAAFATWAPPLADNQELYWWSDAVAVSDPAIAAGRQLYVSRSSAAP